MLLFGNDNLVLQYDGQRWERICVPGGGAIHGLAVDDRGEIWVGGAGQLGRLVREGNRYRFLGTAGEKGLPANFGEVAQIVSGGETEFVRSEKALLVRAGNEWKSIAWPHGNGFDYMLSGIDKRVFAHARNDPLYEIVNGEFARVVEDTRLQSTIVYRVLEPKSGLILLVTKDHGIFRLLQNQITPFPTDIDPLLARFSVRAASTVPGSYMAVAVEHHGAALLDSE